MGAAHMRHSTPLVDRARGRWHGILPALGISDKLLNTRKHQACPFCGGKDRFRYTNHGEDGRYICNACGSGSGVDLVMKLNGWDFAKAAQEIERIMGDVRVQRAPPKSDNDEDTRKAMREVWNQALPIAAGDFVDLYLDKRGLRQETYPPHLRKVERLRHDDEDGHVSWFPAMVAKVVAPDGQPANIHRTYLTPDGEKAPVTPVRKVMRGGWRKGSAVRLYQAGPVMGVAEGIETAIAASELFRVPVWAAINSTNLQAWEPPAGTDQVLIFGDNDPKFGGQAAATALAHRLACAGTQVRIEIPDQQGKDWNDVLLEKRRNAA